ncbi:MAG: SusC/RagA family TonB-linked outer membrane protein, partial [Duncaniella sp.]|nr:SusC/RagA family TonB-linked outer membrane protein [Duncaniella sp.]
MMAQTPADSVGVQLSTTQGFIATGTVIDESGEPVIGATVAQAGKRKNMTVTDLDGHFSISGINIPCKLRVTSVGSLPSVINVTSENASDLKVTLRPVTANLDEVVVVGYATQRKTDLTGSVASISASALADRPVTNATNALAGLAAGLTVTNSGGNTPGYESQSITVRGLGTLNNAAPLVVVDGMTGIAISDINPQDIENISVLKDAASAAIYGSRAANGVILVTTRQGAERAPRVTYSGNVSFETVAKRLNLVTDYADFMEIQNAGLIANGQAPRFSQGKIDEWRNDAGRNPTVYPNTDWQDHIYRNPSVVQNHNLAISGGSQMAQYNISMGYINNPGMVYNTDYERYQLRTNLDINIKPWITVGTNLFGYYDTNNPSAENATAGGDVIFGYGAFNTVPGMTLYDPATGLYGGIQNPEEENVSNANPYRRQWFYDDKYPTKTKRMVGKIYARIKPVKGLTIQGAFSMNYWERNIEHHLTDRDLFRFTTEGPVLIREGVVRTYIRRYNYKNSFRSSELTAKYDFTLGRLETSIFAGMSQEYNKYDQDYYIKYDLVDPSLGAIDAGMTNGSITGNYNEWAMRSYFGRI